MLETKEEHEYGRLTQESVLGSAPSHSAADQLITDTNFEQRPLVTIGLPVFNGAGTIAVALEALVRQDYPNLQIIISDNASTDETLEICERFAQQDSRIRIIRKDINEGAVANFRTVLDFAVGDYFMWAAADDSWYPEFISRLLPLLATAPSVGVAMCAIERHYPDGTPFDLLRFIGPHDPNRLGHRQLFFKSFSAVKYSLFIYGLFRTELLKLAMPNFPEVLGGDRQFMSHLMLVCRFAYLDEVLHTRTYQPKNEQSYWTQMAQPWVLTRQLFVFVKLILGSSITPWWRKPMLLPVLPHFIYFNFRQTPIGRRMKNFARRVKNAIKTAALNFYLPLKSFLMAVGFLGVAVVSTWLATRRGLISHEFAVGILLFPGLLLAALLLMRRWIIRSQKRVGTTLLQNLQILKQLRSQVSAHSEQLNRTLKEVRYLADTLLHPEIGVALVKGNQLSDYLVQRVEKQRKVVEFVRKLEESKIREVYIQELFPGIECQSVPIGAINELTGHANKTDMLYVTAVAKHIGARKMFEFGTYMGRTTLHLAHNAPDGQVFTLNLPPERDPRYASYLGVLFKGREEEKRITQIHSDSREFDTTPYRNQFDFVFVDGDHSYELVKNDTQKAFQLLKQGGVIMWHDYAPKSEGLVRFFQKFTQDKPLFRIRSTCLLVYIDGVDVMNHKLGKLPDSLELKSREDNPYLVESLYHS